MNKILDKMNTLKRESDRYSMKEIISYLPYTSIPYYSNVNIANEASTLYYGGKWASLYKKENELIKSDITWLEWVKSFGYVKVLMNYFHPKRC